jgi:hypothetical protein
VGTSIQESRCSPHDPFAAGLRQAPDPTGNGQCQALEKIADIIETGNLNPSGQSENNTHGRKSLLVVHEEGERYLHREGGRSAILG